VVQVLLGVIALVSVIAAVWLAGGIVPFVGLGVVALVVGVVEFWRRRPMATKAAPSGGFPAPGPRRSWRPSPRDILLLAAGGIGAAIALGVSIALHHWPDALPQ
jgi:hypothetical protein